MDVSRSRNSYIRSPRSVTQQPMGMPLRSLKLAIDFLARVIMGRWPEICPSSTAATSSSLIFWLPSPRPMLTTTLATFGTAMGFLYPKRFISAGITSLRYRSRNRLMAGLLLQCRAAAAADAHFGAVGQQFMAHPGVLIARGADQQHIGNLNRSFLFHDAALHVLRRIGAGVPLDDVGVLDGDGALSRVNAQHTPALALVAPAQHAHLVALTDARICNCGIHESLFILSTGFTRLPGPEIRFWQISFRAIRAPRVRRRACPPARWRH